MSGGARERVDVRHYLRLVWRWKWLLLAIVILIPAAVYFLSNRLPKTYEASTTLFVQATTVSSSDEATAVSVSTSSPTDVARLVNTPLVANVAAKELAEPGQDGRDLLGSVSAEIEDEVGAQDGSGFLTITAQADDPERAAELANAFAEALVAKRTRQAENAIDETIESLSAQSKAINALGDSARLELAGQLRELQALRASQQNTTEIVDPVVVPGAPISPQPRRNTVLGLVFALLLAAGLVPVLDRLDRRIRRSDEMEEITGAPLLAAVPKSAFPGEPPDPSVREAFQTLRAALTSFNVDTSLATVVVTSPSHGDGKTTVAVHLAVALAQDQRDVVLVDGDLRRAQAAKRLGVEPRVGLESVLLEQTSVAEALVDVEGIAGGRLRFLGTASFPPNPSVLLGSERMQTTLAELAEIADMVVIDTPPLMIVGDAIPLLKTASGTIVVGRIDYTDRSALAKVRQIVSVAKGKILGVVATGAAEGALYGYDDYSAYGYSEPDPLVAEEQNGSSRRLVRLPGRIGRRGKQRADKGATS